MGLIAAKHVKEILDVLQNIKGGISSIASSAEVSLEWEQGSIVWTGQYAGANNPTDYAIRTTGFLDPGRYLIFTNGQQAGFGGYTAKAATWSNWSQELGTRWSSGVIDLTVPEGVYARIITRISQDTTITPAQNHLLVYPYSAVLKSAFEISTERSGDVPPVHNPLWIGIAHQGYTGESGSNNDRLPGYAEAAKKGFDYAETDMYQTSDNVLVCSHDPSFKDATTGEVVTISEHTLAELQAHNYYGTVIATLDDIVKSCKTSGIGIVVDQINLEDITPAMTILKKYHMLEHTIFLTNPDASGIISALKTAYPKLKIMLSNGAATASDWVTYANNISDGTCEVYVDLWSTNFTPEQVVALSADLPVGTKIVIFGGAAFDSPNNVLAYAPYVDGIMSNKICFNDVRLAGLV